MTASASKVLTTSKATEPGVSGAAGWRVQSVDRAAGLLRAVADAAGGTESGTVALGDTCGLNRATAWRILSTMESHGLVHSDRRTNQWTIGAGMVDLVRSSGVEDGLRDAHAVLERLSLQTGETASLSVLRQGVLVYDDQVAPPSVVSANWSGRAMSLYATSTGKVLLAWSTESERRDLLPQRLKRFTSTTITDRRKLLRDLEETRRRGYAVCRGEFDQSAWGVSAPVRDRFDQMTAVLSIWGPRDRIRAERFEALGEFAMAAALELSGG